MPSAPTFRSYAAATTLAIALAPAASFGVSFDINRDALTGAGTIVTDSTGDSVLYPFYTTVNGASTSFSLTNTSTTETVAAKVRFRDQVSSRDALDFIVVLSPNDKFDFYVEQNAGVPTAYWKDNSCVVGYPGTVYDDDKSLPFVNPNVSGVPYADSAVGHMEVIGMLNLNGLESGNGGDLDDAANHFPAANGQYYPNNCGLLKDAFKNRENVNSIRLEANGAVLSTAPGAFALANADVGNVLNGSEVITVNGQGVEAGTDAIMVRNTFERGFLAAQSPQDCATITPFNNLNQGIDSCYSLYAWDATEDSHPSLADVNWVGAIGLPGTNTIAVLDELLAAQNGLTGDWSNNPANNVGFDWIVSFPTKYVYDSPLCTGGDNPGNKLVPGCTGAPFGTGLCVGGVSTEPYLDIYGYDEESTTTESPGVNPLTALCDEVQVLTIRRDGQTDNEPSLIQTAADRITVEYDASLDDSNRGWAFLPFSWTPNTPNVATHVVNTLEGAAVAPLLWTVRATNDATQNNGSLRGLNRLND